MPSYQVGDTCYSTALAAVQALASAEVGGITVIGSKAYVVDATNISGTSITYSFLEVGGTGTMTKVATVTPQPCGLLDWQDGLTLGWAVAAAWIATAVVLHIRKAAHS